MKIKEFCTPIKILLLIFIFFVSFLFLPTVGMSKSQTTICDIRPYAYSVVSGTRISGDLNSVYEDDGDTLNIRSSWYWGGGFFEFYTELNFYFEPMKCDELYFDFVTFNAAQDKTISILIFYTDGTRDGIALNSHGYLTHPLDESKYVERVWIRFEDSNFIISGGDRYLFIDLLAVKPAGDNTPPQISIDYHDGDGTDTNPGMWKVNASDPESNINLNAFNVWIDGQIVGNTLGDYEVPNTLGQHTIYVEVENEIGCPTSTSEEITIIDDDIISPFINYTYIGDGTDNNSGEIIISASDESGLFDDPSGSYPVPNTPGLHRFTISATDNDDDRPNDRLTESITISIRIVDDDRSPPEIDIQYVGNSDDNDPGYFEWNVSDQDSGISDLNVDVSYESVEGLSDYTINLGNNETGSWNLPNNLGNYTIEVTASDNDNDRSNDRLTSHKKFSNLVIDDDDLPPEININYIGNGFDVTPGYFEWNVSDADSEISEINVTITYVSSEGLDNYNIPLVGTETGTWNLPSNLGRYIIEISAKDSDDDRSLIVDSLTSELIKEENIIDDDVTYPVLSNLIIVPSIYEINVTFTASDSSGIGDISFLINGDLVEPITQTQCENTYSFIFKNQWLFTSKTPEVIIMVEDGDHDRPDDGLTSSMNGTFENVFYQMYEYIIWQIEQLKIYINETLSECIAIRLNSKLTKAQNHLYEAFFYSENGNITCSLSQDALAKLLILITECKVEFLNRVERIDNDHAEYIENSIHDIRNNIVILMGASTGTELGVNLANIEVNLLNLGDYLEENTKWYESFCLRFLLRSAARKIEKTLFRISLNIDMECKLNCIRCRLEFALCFTNCLLNRGVITQEVADTLLEGITQALEDIELVLNSL